MDKVTIALKNYEAQLQRCKDYYRRNHPNPKPRGRPRKVKNENESEKKEDEVVKVV